MGEFGRGESHSPCFHWGNIFGLNSFGANLGWCESVIGANAIRPYGNIIHRIVIGLDCFNNIAFVNYLG